jgi:hypothetical protein
MGPHVEARMIDQNAFGILVSYYAVEDDEYGLARPEFAARFCAFRDALRACLRDLVLGRDVRALDFGHAQYFEVEEGENVESPLAWARKVRARLAESGFDTVVAVTHGSRWVDDDAESFLSTEHVGEASLVTLSNPSEPLRRALYADTASRTEVEDVGEGWGPGLYLDTEAAEALGMTPKNSPTVLSIAGASFFRAGK